MPPDVSNPSKGASAEMKKRRAGTPRHELARLRARAAERSSEVRERIMVAMLEACGELGYCNVSVRVVLERYGGYRVQFYREFASKAACFAAAYAAESDQLVEAMLVAAAAAPSWQTGLAGALAELGRYAQERPLAARGTLVEVHVAGGPALAKREELFERLTRAIDSARRETGSRHSPPPITAAFMVGTIDAAVCAALEAGAPERFAAAVPELTQMVAAAYFGEEAAGELAAARLE